MNYKEAKTARCGCCERCGYNKNSKALDFYVIENGKIISRKKLEREETNENYDEAKLLCANCREELEDELPDKFVEVELLEPREEGWLVSVRISGEWGVKSIFNKKEEIEALDLQPIDRNTFLWCIEKGIYKKIEHTPEEIQQFEDERKRIGEEIEELDREWQEDLKDLSEDLKEGAAQLPTCLNTPKINCDATESEFIAQHLFEKETKKKDDPIAANMVDHLRDALEVFRGIDNDVEENYEFDLAVKKIIDSFQYYLEERFDQLKHYTIQCERCSNNLEYQVGVVNGVLKLEIEPCEVCDI